MAIFGHRLKRIRGEANLSQKTIAERTGIPASGISHYEGNSRLPDFENLIKLADALGVNLDYLVGRGMCETGEVERRAAQRKIEEIRKIIGIK